MRQSELEDHADEGGLVKSEERLGQIVEAKEAPFARNADDARKGSTFFKLVLVDSSPPE